ncbi:unnamed protein product [Echinostoma caproni]|uniref:DUF3385 domain-containing protein n=1 Tax=Echinostoma caproni TaxID=27848 RepID=A0A183ALG8_9TREM|nr:unnamed protein product [Echinostoma caproni]
MRSRSRPSSFLLTKVKAELLRNITAFTKHASIQTIEQHLVPILCDCLESSIADVQIVAMQSVGEMSGYFHQNELDDIVLPGVMQAYTKSPVNAPIRIHVLRTLTTLVRQISVTALQDHLIPFLLEITKLICVSNSNDARLRGRHRSRISSDLSMDNDKPTSDGTDSPIGIICEIWKSITSTRGNILEPNLIAKEIFPSILPHVLNKDLNIQEFRSVMSSLYGLLDCLDVSVAGSEESMDTTNYRIVPAVTVDAPTGREAESLSGDSPPRFNSKAQQFSAVNKEEHIDFRASFHSGEVNIIKKQDCMFSAS